MKNPTLHVALAVLIYPVLGMLVAAGFLVAGLYYNFTPGFVGAVVVPLFSFYISIGVITIAGKAINNGEV